MVGCVPTASCILTGRSRRRRFLIIRGLQLVHARATGWSIGYFGTGHKTSGGSFLSVTEGIGECRAVGATGARRNQESGNRAPENVEKEDQRLN